MPIFRLVILIILFFCQIVSTIFAQEISINQLQQELANSKEDSTRIRLLNTIAQKLINNHPDSALLLNQEAIALAKKNQYKAKLFELFDTQGNIFKRKQQNDNALQAFFSAKEISEEFDNKRSLTIVLRKIGGTYNTLNKKRLAIDYLEQAWTVAVEIGDPEEEFNALNQMGNVYSYLTEYDKADEIQKRSLTIQITLGDKRKQARVFMNLGNNAARSNNLEKAMGYYIQAMELMREIDDKNGEALIYRMMAYSYYVMGENPLALENYQNALTILEDTGSVGEMAGVLESIAEVYLSMEDFPTTLAYYEQAYAIREKEGSSMHLSALLIRRGKIFVLQKDYKNALQYFNQVLQMNRLEKWDSNSSGLFWSISNCYEKLDQLDSALFYIQPAIEISTQANDFVVKSRSLTSLGTIYFKQGKLDQSKKSLEKAIEAASFAGLIEQEMEASGRLYQAYKKQNNFERALRYFERNRQLQDSLFNEKRIKQIARLEANYEFEQEKQQLAFQRTQEFQKQQAFRRMMWIALGVTLSFVGIIFRYYRSKQKANEQLSQLNKELVQQKAVVEQQKEKLEELDKARSRFFTNISHEFRTPLTIISGMIEQVMAKPDLWLEKGGKMIRQNSANLLNLVNQILDLRKLESQGLELQLVQGDVVRYLRYITQSYQSYAQGKGIQLHFLTELSAFQMDYDPDKMLRIISNLLSNAIKFTPPGGNIYFQLDQDIKNGSAFFEIKVKDTGAGIPEDQLAHIFDRFFQVDDSSTRKGEGTGIGLALCKELVKLLNGEIDVNSEPGKGTTFTIFLPVTRNSAIKEGLASVSKEESDILVPLPPDPEQGDSLLTSPVSLTSDLPTLLIVEDNPDVAQFLVACLQDEYQLHLAGNGREGIDIAIEQIPDLIVSDVMMPEKDGFELCDTLKQDERTSHIPIILLTAKADLDSKISGLERGADAYMTKPFEQEELLVRLKKLLELRKRLQEHYGSFEFKSAEKNVPPNPEDVFLMKIKELVEENMADDGFGNVQLARKMNLSESQLYRKIKALTDKSTALFIRSIRLHRAKALLQNQDLTISEIAYDVGFTDPAYFSRSFSNEFGQSPNAMRKQ